MSPAAARAAAAGGTPAGDAQAHRDVAYMRNALAIGRRNLGLTWPNPSVGAVLVSYASGAPVVVARGVTQPGGRPHAERVALDAAGPAARGATLYVTLEPCSHHGKTPPCAEAVIHAGVARVVYALADPDPRVSGRGAALLRQAGLAVTGGVAEAEAARSHVGHVTRVTKGRPAVLLKLARTADGYAAAASNERLMITGALANARVHLMRAHADAIMVGLNTVVADDPRLTTRLPGLEHRSPVRVVVDSRLALPLEAGIVQSAGAPPTWVITTIDAPAAAERRLVDAGVEVMRVGADDRGRVRLDEGLRLLAVRGITRVFCEGGPALAEGLAQADLVDALAIATGPRRLAAQDPSAPGLAAVGPALARHVETRLRLVSEEPAGADVFQHFERA
ncbi:bifunctional diaminohydroxyphosphoribosylaminopyrimidine deaminase/5-amino-6-(5-phosphoribosylamino)uracil reductase RibD [Salinarimonas chemoclinalis]|uniref:bifunctional diaminohydroxyphosphoribosylaminopyrimidine deaminase/5-amino-6-(5-phosphoribosylamino)uracil reductase RibD n=1 Tax=Salinarimonas chemoclinalis TaxID=3241599 RepID=UPI003557CDE6